MLRKLFLPLVLALAAGCETLTDPAPPAEDLGVRLSLSVSRNAVARGDTVRLVGRIANRGTKALRIDFGSGCRLLPYVEDASGKVVFPSGGGWMCTAALSHLELAPGETRDEAFTWVAQVPAGTYRAYASLNGSVAGEALTLRTPQESIQVQ